MRRTPVFFAVTALVAVGLVGCSTTPDASCVRPSAQKLLDLVEVSGAAGAEPDVSIRTPFHVSDTQVADLETGDGTIVTDDSQLVALDLTIISGDSGEPVVATPYDGTTSRVFPAARWVETIPGLRAGMECASAGSRFVVALAPGDITPETASGLGLAEGESAVAVVDLHKVYLAKADGADQFTEGHGLPTVVRAPDGRPGIIVPDATAPTDLRVEVLKRGNGEEVPADATVRVHYTGVLWDDPADPFETTWDTEPASLPLDGVVPGLTQALEGQTVGSQVLVVIPPDLGYGEAGQGAIPPSSTLVFVVDILGIDE